MQPQIPDGLSLWTLSVHPQQGVPGLEAMLSLDAVNISVNWVTGGQEAISSLPPVPILNKQINNVV